MACTAIAAALRYLARALATNLRSRFGFQTEAAGFDIAESLIGHYAFSPYRHAFVVGALNTLRVALTGIVLATIDGTLLGIGGLSDNSLVHGVCCIHVELFRNLPLLLQLRFWYRLLSDGSPPAPAKKTFDGDRDAANSRNLSRARVLRLVVLPQALRMIVPPLTAQYLNSSAAVAIGGRDILSIANSVLNQTSRAVECIAIIVLGYLVLSLSIAAATVRYPRRNCDMRGRECVAKHLCR